MQLGKTEDGFAINQYFVDHPEMVLGDGKAVLGLAKLHPVRLNIRRTVTLLQKDNVTDNICACVGTERIRCV